MSCTGSLSLRYNIGLKCKLPKILLTTKMIQHSKSVQTKTRRNAISNKKNRCRVFLGHCLAWFRTLGYFYWPAAEPLAVARGTQGFRGTPVENHCSRQLLCKRKCVWYAAQGRLEVHACMPMKL